MKKLMIALAMVFAFNLISSIANLSAPVSFAQEEPAPAPEPKPEKPGE
ncbi:MAG TPA: hypothetical protein VGB09_05955 [Candidatus Binatia bacterium]|jgi:hypothetical protein